VYAALRAARTAGSATLECSLDLGRTVSTVELGAAGWRWRGRLYPFLASCKERTVYHWRDDAFHAVARYTTSLIKLVPTEWGAPTFEIDGIKMLPTAQVSPYADAERKVGLVQPGGKTILDTCGGLGYFAGWCLHGGAARVLSYEKNPDVVWLRSLNPWSPDSPWSDLPRSSLELAVGDVAERIRDLGSGSVDAILHDPPRFGIAGELYSQAFYDQLARVVRRGGRLFHYTGAPNKVSSGRDLAQEVIGRLRRAGFTAEASGDGVLATRTRHEPARA
jgi:hypothetical protein